MKIKLWTLSVVAVLAAVIFSAISRNTVQANSDAVLLFDGVCVLCNGFVNFIIATNSRKDILFAPLQTTQATKLLKELNMEEYAKNINSVVLIERSSTGSAVYSKSTAALRVLLRLDEPLPILYSLMIFPSFIRDTVYDLIATHRYDVFGKEELCRAPTPEEQTRFLK